ncbi:hypothetical protein [Dactylosporangium cerinum]
MTAGGRLVAVADGPAGRFATINDHGIVSVWGGAGEPVAQFGTGIDASASDRIAITTDPTGTGPEIVVSTWRHGVTGFDPDGGVRWRRRDIRHACGVRALPVDGGARLVAGVVTDRTGGLVLGATGGTRHRVARADLLAGWPDGSLFVADRHGTVRQQTPGGLTSAGTTHWKEPLGSFGVLDAAVGDGVLIGGGYGRLTHIALDGTVTWRARLPVPESITKVSATGSGWVCLSTAVRRITPVGTIGPPTEVPGPPGGWIGFAAAGRYLVGADGQLVDLERR